MIQHTRSLLPLSYTTSSPAGLILSDLEAVDKDHLDFLVQTHTKDTVNFQKCRQQARVIQQVQKYQSSPYNFHSMEVSDTCMQNRLTELCDLEVTVGLCSKIIVFQYFGGHCVCVKLAHVHIKK